MAGKIACVEIKAWLPKKDGVQNNRQISYGHVALRTYYEDEKGTIVEEGIYASFWPKADQAATPKSESSCSPHKCDCHKDHLHSKNQDDLLYKQEPPAENFVKLYTLDIEKIKKKFQEFTAKADFSWGTFGSWLAFEDDKTKNCAGLCFSLLEAGGLFSKLGYQDNHRGMHYLPGRGFIGGVSGFAIFTMVLVGGAVGGSLTIEMGPGSIAGCVIGSLAGWYLLTVGMAKLVNELCTPREVLGFAKQIAMIEKVLLSKDIPGVIKKIETEILRLRQISSFIFFSDTSAQNKAIHLEAALLRAKRADGLQRVIDFLFYSYKEMPSIFDIANELRASFLTNNISRPTATFKNLFIALPAVKQDPAPQKSEVKLDEDQKHLLPVNKP